MVKSLEGIEGVGGWTFIAFPVKRFGTSSNAAFLFTQLPDEKILPLRRRRDGSA